MDAEKMLDELIGELCAERGEPVPGLPAGDKANCFRALCNVRPPAPVSEKFLKIQDEYLSACTAARGTVSADDLVRNGNVALWRGDITRLEADAIVNACNRTLLGCFYPLHGCVDNVIHSCAGVQVRLDCAAMMRGRSELNGRVRVTRAYNLPCGYIFHTVGPIVRGAVTADNERDLADIDDEIKQGLEIVPVSDVDVQAAKLFGPDLKLQHQSFGDWEMQYTLDEEQQAYPLRFHFVPSFGRSSGPKAACSTSISTWVSISSPASSWSYCFSKAWLSRGRACWVRFSRSTTSGERTPAF